MITPANFHAQEGTPCCQHAKHTPVADKMKSVSDKVLAVLEKVSLVAIGVLAAMSSLTMFVPTFVLGVILGVLQRADESVAAAHNSHHAGCSHGFLEHLTGVKLPASISLIANVLILAAHIDHHTAVFTPIVGITLGMWAGRSAAPTINLCYRKIVAVVTKPCENLSAITAPLLP